MADLTLLMNYLLLTESVLNKWFHSKLSDSVVPSDIVTVPLYLGVLCSPVSSSAFLPAIPLPALVSR